ncbi:hypothetical protein HanXRQr2_Chr17g0797901 [Helianthus annuus]|nr:hypothetical protein HanXRQr2_Chr17g0797901 [Helianthus annuus]KAJ0812767.1 hypothetical protein HanPSC8_Chr17g0765661 [Helianthus annuus]
MVCLREVWRRAKARVLFCPKADEKKMIKEWQKVVGRRARIRVLVNLFRVQKKIRKEISRKIVTRTQSMKYSSPRNKSQESPLQSP